MSQITYFQRYSQPENWITNSTLLLLSRVNHFDPRKFEVMLREVVTKTELKVGVRFAQQTQGQSSVADGVIEQEGFKVIIETKLYDNFSGQQLKEHLRFFDEYNGTGILLALSKNKVNKKQDSQIIDELKRLKSKVLFASTSYKGLADAIFEVLDETDFEMREIVDDYVALCQELKLVTIADETMLVVTTGWSIQENFRYDIYYDPADRTHTLPFTYIGLYDQKAIRGVGKVLHEVTCEFKDGKPIDHGGLSNVSLAERARIEEIVKNTSYYDLTQKTRFFVVDKFWPTTSNKKSGSVRGKQYLFLKNQFPEFSSGMQSKQVAELINGREWT